MCWGMAYCGGSRPPRDSHKACMLQVHAYKYMHRDAAWTVAREALVILSHHCHRWIIFAIFLMYKYTKYIL